MRLSSRVRLDHESVSRLIGLLQTTTDNSVRRDVARAATSCFNADFQVTLAALLEDSDREMKLIASDTFNNSVIDTTAICAAPVSTMPTDKFGSPRLQRSARSAICRPNQS